MIARNHPIARHVRPRSTHRKLSAAGEIALAALVLCGAVLAVPAIAHAGTGHGRPSASQRLSRLVRAIEDEATVGIDRTRFRSVIVVRYSTAQPLCRRSQAGDLGLVVGNGEPFLARCDQDGPDRDGRYVWDEIP